MKARLDLKPSMASLMLKSARVQMYRRSLKIAENKWITIKLKDYLKKNFTWALIAHYGLG